jgi:hypothetical protein
MAAPAAISLTNPRLFILAASSLLQHEREPCFSAMHKKKSR